MNKTIRQIIKETVHETALSPYYSVPNDEMLNGYLEIMLHDVDSNENEENPGEPKNFQFSDISMEAMSKAATDVATFKKLAGPLLDGIPESQAGYDLWQTRVGAGVGFWDRGLEEVGEQLTAICKQMGHVDAYVGDDGKIYFM